MAGELSMSTPAGRAGRPAIVGGEKGEAIDVRVATARDKVEPDASAPKSRRPSFDGSGARNDAVIPGKGTPAPKDAARVDRLYMRPPLAASIANGLANATSSSAPSAIDRATIPRGVASSTNGELRSFRCARRRGTLVGAVVTSAQERYSRSPSSLASTNIACATV